MGPGSQSRAGTAARADPLVGVLRETEAARLGRQAAARTGAPVPAAAPRGAARGRPLRADGDQRDHDRRGRVPGRRLTEGAGRAARPHPARLAGAPAAATGLRHDQRRGLSAATEDAKSRRRCASRAACASRPRPRRRAAARSPGAPFASRSCSATGSRSPAGSWSAAAASRSSASTARPDTVVRGLTPPGGAARSWSASGSLPADALLQRLIDTRMELVRSDQFQGFLSNPDALGRDRTVYVYETTAAPHAVAASSSSSSGGGPLDGAARRRRRGRRCGRGARLLGPQLEEPPAFQRIGGRGRPARRHRPHPAPRPQGPRLASLGATSARRRSSRSSRCSPCSASSGRAPRRRGPRLRPPALSVESPDGVRGGLLYQARFTIVAHQELKHATLVLNEKWIDGLTVNTIEPSPVNEASRDGNLALELGHLAAGARYVLYHRLPGQPDHRRLADAASSSSKTASSRSPRSPATLRIWP